MRVREVKTLKRTFPTQLSLNMCTSTRSRGSRRVMAALQIFYVCLQCVNKQKDVDIFRMETVKLCWDP